MCDVPKDIWVAPEKAIPDLDCGPNSTYPQTAAFASRRRDYVHLGGG